MAISTEQRVDYLFKKLGFTLSKTAYGTEKSPSNESIPSPLIIPGGIIWSESGPDKIPSTPPSSDTQYVKVFGTASALQMTMDDTSPSRRTFICRQTPGITTSTILGDWIDKQFGSGYGVKIYANNPNGSGEAPVLLDPNGVNDDTWFFDYSSGVLNFNGPSLPDSVLTNNIFIVGWRYTGAKGVLSEGGQAQTSLSIANLNVSGVSTLGTVKISSGIVSSITGVAVTFIGNLTGTASYATTAGVSTTATDVIGGIASVSSLFVNTLGISTLGTVKISSGIITSTTGTAVSFIGNLTGTASTASFAATAFNLQGFDFNTSTVGSAKTATDVIGGIASVSSLFVNTLGISTLGTVKISSGIITSTTGTAVSFIGNLTGTASTASFATTAFTLNGRTESQFNVASATTSTNVIGGIASVSSLFVNTLGISTLGTVKISSGIITSSGVGTVTYFGDGSKLSGIKGVTVEFQAQTSETLFPTLASNSGVSSIGIATTGSTAFCYITSSGNIGIGTTIPTAKLTVNGNVSISGITTVGVGNIGVVINGITGIVTSINPSTTVTFVGNLTGTASTTSFATTSFTLNGRTESQLNVAFAQTAGISTNVIGGIGSITQLSVSGVTTSGELIGGGSYLRNLQGTHLVSYSSHSESSNSSSSISGISTYTEIGILSGTLSIDFEDQFGYSVATSADGKTIVVGARRDELNESNLSSGIVYVFDRTGNSFNQVGILTGTLTSTGDFFGSSVATSSDGKTIIVGSTSDGLPGLDGTGLVYVFDRVGNLFNQVGILTGFNAIDAGDNFGVCVTTSSDGKTIIVGASSDEIGAIGSTGVVYVFDRSVNSFNQVGILTGSLSVDSNDLFGFSVATSADGKTIVVGAPADDTVVVDTGLAYVFERTGNSFNQIGILTGSNAIQSEDQFGFSVAISADGKTIAVGAKDDEVPGANTATGVVYVFDRSVNSFNQVGILTGTFSTQAGDRFGNSIAISADGKKIVIGAMDDEIPSPSSSGAVYVFNRVGNTFNRVASFRGSLSIDGQDFFGNSVAVSADGKSIIAGAFQDSLVLGDINGIAYVFDEVKETYLHSNTQGNIGIGTSNPTSKLQVLGGDIRVGINTSQGMILTSPDGTKYRLIVANGGALSTVVVP